MRTLRTLAILPFVLATLSSDASALTEAAVSCRDTIAESVTRYVKTAAKTIARCHARRSDGARPIEDNCNDPVEASLDAKLYTARQNAYDAVQGACTGSGEVLADYLACPAPAVTSDDGGATAGIDDFEELVDCLLALSDAHVGDVARAAQGAPEARLLDPLRKCQGRLGKGSNRVMLTYLAERRRCQSELDAGGGDGGYGCESADPRGRITLAVGRYVDKIGDTCSYSPEVLEQLEACSSDSTELISCSSESAAQHGALLAHSLYLLEANAGTTTTTLPSSACIDSGPQCDGECGPGLSCAAYGSACQCVVTGTGPCEPATIRREIISRFSTEVDSVTALNAGWSGLAVDIDVPNRSGDVVNVTCDQDCENCDVSLDLRPTSGSPVRCSCTSNPATSCEVVNGSDPANCGSIDPTCRCYFGAPLAIAAGGNPACVGLRIRSDYGGKMNLRTGEWGDQLHLAAVVYLGLDVQAPCPTCEGDPVQNDGVRGGTCSGGLGGTACDINGVHPTFGNLSNDCLPVSASNISGTGLIIDVNLTTGASTLPATLPCDTPADKLCHCRTCTGNSLLSCSNDAQCQAIGAGTCTASGGAGVRLNQCDDFLCSANGECTTGPVDQFCDGAIFPDGSGYIPCTTNSDCSNSNAGACTIQTLRRCFPDPIDYVGTPDTYSPTSVSAFCVAPTSNPAINLASGLPGAGALLLKFENDVRCQSDPNIQYDFPNGTNCGGPPPECADSAAPTCGGTCPAGQSCTNAAGVCTCTDIPVPSCIGSASPACGGVCNGTGEVCLDNAGQCECQVVTLPQCSEASAPVCGGVCPTGELCQSVGNTCECGAPGLPSCGSAIAPSCAGVCEVGQACVASGDTCGCLQLPTPTCSEATAPLCLGTCSLGSTCGAVGDACQCTPLPLP